MCGTVRACCILPSHVAAVTRLNLYWGVFPLSTAHRAHSSGVRDIHGGHRASMWAFSTRPSAWYHPLAATARRCGRKNGYRFGFRSTTPIWANLGECSRQNALVRGSARPRRPGYPEGVLTVRHGKLHRQQRPLWSRSARWHFKLFSPLFAFCGPSSSSRPKGRISRSAPIPTAKIRREGPLDPLKGCGNYGSGAWSATRVLGNKVTKNRVWNRTTSLSH